MTADEIVDTVETENDKDVLYHYQQPDEINCKFCFGRNGTYSKMFGGYLLKMSKFRRVIQPKYMEPIIRYFIQIKIYNLYVLSIFEPFIKMNDMYIVPLRIIIRLEEKSFKYTQIYYKFFYPILHKKGIIIV